MTLSNGGWAEVRRVTAGDEAHLARLEHERGFASDTLGIIALLPRLITEWSFEEAISETSTEWLPQEDVIRVVSAARGISDPNLLRPSSNGEPKAEKASRRGSGASA